MVIKIPPEIEGLVQMITKDFTRLALGGVLFSREAKEMVATNGHILGILPCDDLKDLKKSIVVPGEALRGVKGHVYLLELKEGYYIGMRHISHDDHDDLHALHTYKTIRPFTPIEVEYPDYKNLIETDKKPIVYRICLGTEVLSQLIKSVGTHRNPGVVLEFSESGITYILFKSRPKGIHGIIMPQRIPEHFDSEVGLLKK